MTRFDVTLVIRGGGLHWFQSAVLAPNADAAAWVAEHLVRARTGRDDYYAIQVQMGPYEMRFYSEAVTRAQ